MSARSSLPASPVMGPRIGTRGVSGLRAPPAMRQTAGQSANSCTRRRARHNACSATRRHRAIIWSISAWCRRRLLANPRPRSINASRATRPRPGMTSRALAGQSIISRAVPAEHLRARPILDPKGAQHDIPAVGVGGRPTAAHPCRPSRSTVPAVVHAAPGGGAAPFGPAPRQQVLAYQIDRIQRSVLVLDTLRERANNLLTHEAAGMPLLLDFDYETILDARRFDRSANYALLAITRSHNDHARAGQAGQGGCHRGGPARRPRPRDRRFQARLGDGRCVAPWAPDLFCRFNRPPVRGPDPGRRGGRVAPFCGRSHRAAWRDPASPVWKLPNRLGGDHARRSVRRHRWPDRAEWIPNCRTGQASRTSIQCA